MIQPLLFGYVANTISYSTSNKKSRIAFFKATRLSYFKTQGFPPHPREWFGFFLKYIKPSSDD
jgi:hypothetical protein